MTKKSFFQDASELMGNNKAGKAHYGKYVAYYRVSTKKQGDTGYGLEAQQKAVQEYLNGGRWKLVGEFTEVESGRNNRRMQFKEALKLCKKTGAKLVVAKLDRLSRNLLFLATLMESNVEFICCDMPQANRLTIQIMGAMAEDESVRIRKRTKDALAVAKAKGVKLGNPHDNIRLKAGKKGNKSQNKEADLFAWEILPLIDGIVASGLSSLKDIADALNARGVTTQRGGTWHPSTVSNILKRRKGR